MTKVKSWVTGHKKLLIIIAAVGVAVAVLLGLFSSMGSAQAAGPPTAQTTPLEKMELQQIVSATGTLQGSETRQVSSSLSYDIAELFVAVGDEVTAGQNLATLDITDIEKNIADARRDLGDAAAQDQLSLAQAERKLQEAYESRNIKYNKNDKAIGDARDALDRAQGEKDSAKKARDNAKDYMKNLEPAEGEEPSAEYQQAAADYETAKATYEQKKTAVETAESSYDKSVEARDTGYRNDTISIENCQDTVDTQKLRDSGASYRTQLEKHQDELEDAVITAPVGGTITEMTAKVGQSAGGMSSAGSAGFTGSSSGSSLFTIENTKKLEISAAVPEYDAVDLRLGMTAEITSDALDGQSWQGKVTDISPKATDSSGNFTVTVEVTSEVGDLAIGMNAKLNIITESKTDVYAVPYDFVTTNAEGESVVLTPADADESAEPDSSGGAPAMATRQIVVTTGMEGDYYIEISSPGLSDGLPIITDPEGITVAAEDVPSGGFMMGGMGGGGG